MAATEVIAGLSKGKAIRELEVCIQELFFKLDQDAKQAAIAFLQGRKKVWAKWYWYHMDRHPVDAKMTLYSCAKISPYWRLIVEGVFDIADKHMRGRYPEWQAAAERNDIEAMNDLLIADNPIWLTIMGRERLMEAERQGILKPSSTYLKQHDDDDDNNYYDLKIEI